MPVPTTLALSVVELVLGCTVSTNGVAVVEDLSFPVVGVLPAHSTVLSLSHSTIAAPCSVAYCSAVILDGICTRLVTHERRNARDAVRATAALRRVARLAPPRAAPRAPTADVRAILRKRAFGGVASENQLASSGACFRWGHDRSEGGPERAWRASGSPTAASRHLLPLVDHFRATDPHLRETLSFAGGSFFRRACDTHAFERERQRERPVEQGPGVEIRP